MKQIDLRSDTVTRPTQEMLEAMMAARWEMMCTAKTPP
jgi:threonine aldolase